MRRFHWSNSGRRFGFACALGLSAAYVAVTGASGQPQACGPGAGPCDMPHNMPGCDDVDCCETVCAVNPACCQQQWDALCVQLAAKLCVGGGANVCAGAPEIFLGNTDFSTVNATTDGVETPGDCGPFGDEQVYHEIWFDYNADFTGTLQITTCEELGGSADYDSRLAAYVTCTCPADNANFLGCNDDDPNNPCGTGGGGFHSTLEIPVTVGSCYKIRVGGFTEGDMGTGTLRLDPVNIPDACVNGIGDCLQVNGSVGCSDQACCAAICANNPDCCDVDWDQACADAAATDCGALPCGPIDTSAANLDEGEPCGDDTNGGCNSTPPAFTDIVSGDVIAGTAWGDGGTRDTDWYRINVTSADDADGDGQVDIHYNVLAELPIVSFLLVDPVGNCNLDDLETPGTVAYSQSCTQIGFGMATVAAPGEYFVFAATGTATGGAVFDGYPCPLPGLPMFGDNYLLCVNVVDDGEVIDTTCPSEQEPCPWDLNGSGDVGILDLLALLAAWGPNPGDPADFDGNGTVDIFDLLTLIANWGPCP